MNELIPWLQDLLGPGAEPAVLFITDWAGPLGWWIVAQLVFIFAGISRGLQITALSAVALVTNGWLKWLFAEGRPFLTDSSIQATRATVGFGMPSGHAQGAVAVWGGMAWQNRKRIILLGLFIGLAFLTGASRIYLGVHSPAQVLVGWILGAVVLVGIIYYWDNITALTNKLSWGQLWLTLVGLCAFTVAINEVILAYRTDFVVPAEWLINHAATAGVAQSTQADLGLLSRGSSILVVLIAGFCAIGILHRKWSALLSSLKQKFLAVIAAILMTVLLATLGRLIQESILGLALLAFVQPLLCVYLPMRALNLWVKDS